jgi:curved DNA-binding protein CbpA
MVAALLNSGTLTQTSLQKIRATQVADVLRTALLWIDGHWEFDPRVRFNGEAQVELDINRILRECARHLPLSFLKSRFTSRHDLFSIDSNKEIAGLSPIEEFMVSRTRLAPTAIQFADLIGNGLPEEEGVRSVYALSLAGLLQRSDWPIAFDSDSLARLRTASSQTDGGAQPPTVEKQVVEDVDVFIARVESAKNHYEALNVSRGANLTEIKAAYHLLARHFHPDRFHQSDAVLRTRIEDAFARVAHAYEVLNDPMRRAEYDQRGISKSSANAERSAPVAEAPEVPPRANADSSFRQGTEAFKRQDYDAAIRFFAEAAILEPKRARYRAHYGYALMNRPKSRRAAENELLAALALEPDNAQFRVMLAELYQSGGMRRRAEAEAARALTIDPKNQKARALLESLQKK